MAGISTPSPNLSSRQGGRHCTGGRQSLHPAGTNESELHRQVTMRAETQKIVEEIKQSVGLLRRHL
jgi:hypothetical protein